MIFVIVDTGFFLVLVTAILVAAIVLNFLRI